MADVPKKVIPPAEQMIARARYNEARDEAKTLKERVAALETELTAAKAATGSATEMQEALAAAKAEAKSSAAAWDEERALLTNGITDPYDVGLVRTHFAAAVVDGGDAAPKTIADYLTGIKAKDAIVPKGLAYLLTPVKPANGAADKPATPKPANNANPPPASGAVTAAALRRATDLGQSTGDWSQFDALKTAAAAARAGTTNGT